MEYGGEAETEGEVGRGGERGEREMEGESGRQRRTREVGSVRGEREGNEENTVGETERVGGGGREDGREG